jgi:hypothetical protein
VESFFYLFLMPTVSRQSDPQGIHLGIGWEIAVVSTFALVIIAVSTVVIRQYTRKKRDLRSIGLEHNARSDKNWPTSILNKRKRRRKKSRKKKAKELDVTTIDLESDDIEEVESFEDDMAPLQKDGVGMGVGVSGSELQQHVDVPKPTRCKPNSLPLSDIEMDQFRVKPWS